MYGTSISLVAANLPLYVYFDFLQQDIRVNRADFNSTNTQTTESLSYAVLDDWLVK